LKTLATNLPPETFARAPREPHDARETRVGLATLGRAVALVGLIALSLLTAAAAQSLLRGWTWIMVVAILVAAWRPRWAIALFLALLPVFGNKPGTRQVYMLVLLGSSLNMGLATCSLVSWLRGRTTSLTGSRSRNLLFVLLALYGVASTLTLSTLPLTQIWHDSVQALGGVTNPVTVLALWLRATETDAAYSVVSVILTWYAIALALFIRREIAADARSALLFASAVAIGLIAVITVGILDFYQLADLRPLRQLDPVVNYFGQQRLQATFGHSGWFAEYLVMSLGYLAIVLAGIRRVRWAVLVIALLLLLAELGLILTYQRGGWLSHVFPLLTIWLAIFYAADAERAERSDHGDRGDRVARSARFRELLRRSLPKLALALPLTVGLALVVFLGVVQLGWFGSGGRFNTGSYVERATGLFDTSNRSMYLATGLKLGRLHPVLGAGSESFAFTYMSEYLRPGGVFYGRGDDPLPVLYGSAHNVYLQTLTGKGAVGLVLLLALMACVVIGGGRILLRQDDLPRSTVLLLLITIGSVLGFACYGVVQEVFYIQSIQYLMFTTFAIAGAIAEPWLQIAMPRVRWLWIALAGLFVLHLAFEYGYPGRTRDRAFWQEAVREGSVLGITEIDSRGTRFRWSGARAFLDLPCSAHAISVPVRSLSDVPQQVEVIVNGRMIDRVTLADHAWRDLKYPLPRSPWFMRSHCVELHVDPLWQPPGDPRRLGVMVGPYSWQ
jgi:hypothetical protein